MTLGVLEYLISVNDSGVKSGINKSENTIKRSAERAGRSLKEYGGRVSAWTIAKGQMLANVTTRAVKTLASTTKNLIKESVSAYADYEQLVGGVETLFKDSAVQVQKFAKEAYKTAGISANKYMETVTSFSASLLQSLEGDTDKAADYADMAVQDMADNANKMGSSMESIQNAYQGFAKQNYTMLDNLKLGYGGTRTEMERLLSDAGKLTNRTFDISKLSDVYEAIHIIQQEMGIYGTTQKEAEGTITGSINMMKASWQDLLTSLGSGKNIRETSKNLTKSLKLVLKNITPVATNAIKNIFSSFKDILPELKSAVKGIWTSLKDSFGNSPILSRITQKIDDVMGFFSLISDLMTDYEGTMEKLEGSDSPILKSFSTVIKLGSKLMTDLSEAVEDSDSLLFGLLKGGVTFLTDAMEQFAEWLSRGGAEKIADVIVSVVSSLASVVDQLVTPLANIISEVLQSPSVWSAIESLVDSAGSIIFNSFVELAAVLAESLGFDGSGIRSLKITPKSSGSTGEGTNGGTTTGRESSHVIPAGELTLTNGHKMPINITAPKSSIGAGTWIAGLAGATKIGGMKGAIGYTMGMPLVEGIANAIKEKNDPNSTTNRLRNLSKSLHGNDESPFIRRLKFAFGIYDSRTLEEKGRQYTNKKATGQSGIDTSAAVDAIVKDVEQNLAKYKKLGEIRVSARLSDDALNALRIQLSKYELTVKVTPILGTIKDLNPTGNGSKDQRETPYTMYAPNAKGNWSVPYDNFPALLHRDEMVLTKSQARRYRDGEGSSGGDMGDAIAYAVEKAMSKVYVMMSGEKVGDLTTRRIRNNLNASSYSKLRAYGG